MKKKTIVEILKYILLSVLVLLAIGPFFYMINTSLQETNILMGAAEPEYTFNNYVRLFTKIKFLRWTLNSIVFAGTVALITIFIDTLAGYALIRYRFKGRGFVFGLILLSMMLPTAVFLFPLFYIVLNMNMLNTFPGLILPMVAGPFGVFFMRQFLLSIPVEIQDAAKIDGCSEFGVLYRIIFPLARPAQAILAIVSFMGAFSTLIWPLIVISNKDMYTLTMGLASIPGVDIIEWGLVAAGAIMAMVPLLIVFIIFQRQFMEALTKGAVKG